MDWRQAPCWAHLPPCHPPRIPLPDLQVVLAPEVAQVWVDNLGRPLGQRQLAGRRPVHQVPRTPEQQPRWCGVGSTGLLSADGEPPLEAARRHLRLPGFQLAHRWLVGVHAGAQHAAPTGPSPACRVMRLERFGLRAATLKFEPHTLPEGQQLEGTGPGRGHGQGQAAQRPLQPRSSLQQELACAPGQRCYHVSADPWEDEGQYASATGGLEKQNRQPRAGPSTLLGAPKAAEGEEQPLQLSAFEQLWRQGQLQHAEQQAVVAGGTWQRRLAAASRAGGKSAASSWQQAAQCWALGLARSAGGEWAAQRAQRWLGLL